MLKKIWSTHFSFHKTPSPAFHYKFLWFCTIFLKFCKELLGSLLQNKKNWHQTTKRFPLHSGLNKTFSISDNFFIFTLASVSILSSIPALSSWTRFRISNTNNSWFILCPSELARNLLRSRQQFEQSEKPNNIPSLHNNRKKNFEP